VKTNGRKPLLALVSRRTRSDGETQCSSSSSSSIGDNSQPHKARRLDNSRRVGWWLIVSYERDIVSTEPARRDNIQQAPPGDFSLEFTLANHRTVRSQRAHVHLATRISSIKTPFICLRAYYFSTGRGAKYCDDYVCLSARISQKPHGRTSRNSLCMFPAALVPPPLTAIR